MTEGGDPEAYVAATLALLGLPDVPEWREEIVANLRQAAGAAGFLLAFELPDAVETPQVFEA